MDDELLEETEEDDGTGILAPGSERKVDEIQAVPLNPTELALMNSFAAAMSTISDSKLDRLRLDLDEARSAGHSTIVFTQFTDTLDYLRDSLVPAYRSQLATFTGDGGHLFMEIEGWVPISKRDLVEALNARQVSVLLATDAASEGLNLQAASYLINYDMPWNPMRVEQRIGRIDRLGQVRDKVHIRHYFIPGTVEEAVYNALSQRIDDFRQMLGNLQPILGATERAFRDIFKAPRSERAAAQASAIKGLLQEVAELDLGGVELTSEDPMPVPQASPAPVTLAQLREAVQERLGADLDRPDRHATWDPARASRDREGWVALATYGHPLLQGVLGHHGATYQSGQSALVTAGGGPIAAVRADRTPPEEILNLNALAELGAPLVRGEAEALAMTLALRAEDARLRRQASIVVTDHLVWEENIRARFRSIVRSLLMAKSTALKTLGPSPAPFAVWLELGQDPAAGLRYAEAFRRRLAIPFEDLVLPQPEHTQVNQSTLSGPVALHQLTEDLTALMADYHRYHK